MGITKYSPDDVKGLSERIKRIEWGIKNLKMERKVYFSDAIRGAEWINWTPAYSTNIPASFTFINVTTYQAKYCAIGKIVFFYNYFKGTTGGSADKSIIFTLPITASNSNMRTAGGCEIWNGGIKSGFWVIDSYINADKVMIQNYDYSNWGLGVGRGATVQGFYRIA